MKNPLRYTILWLLALSLLLSACTEGTDSSTQAPATGEATSAQEGTDAAPTAATEPVTEAPATDVADFQYEANEDGSLTLIAYTGSAAEPVIPAQINGNPVTAIGPSCFAGLVCLEKVTVPEGIAVIGDYAFECCSRLKKIYLPASLLTIGDGAFSGCASLVLVDLQEGLHAIGRGAFLTCTSLVFLDLPASLMEIGAFAFSGCQSLASVIFNGDELAILPDRLFYGCSSLASLRLSRGITSVGRRAFSGCENLKSLYFASPLTRVGSQAFEECAALSSVDLSVTAIEEETFSGCTSMNYFSVSEDTTSIGYRAFMSSGITDLYLPVSVTTIAEGAFAVSQIRSLSLAEESSFQLINGSLYSADGKTLLCCFPEDPYAEEPAEEIIIPEGVEVIAGNAFSCIDVERVILPETVKEVKAYAFSDSAVTRVNIPEGAQVDPEAYVRSAMEEVVEPPVPEPEEEKAPETIGSEAGEKSLFKPEDFSEYLVISNDDFDTWSEEYLTFCRQYFPTDMTYFPYTALYKGEVVPHFKAMTCVQNRDPEMWAEAASQFGDDFEETYIMMDHGLFTELRRGKMCDDLVLYSGVYDSQLMAAAGTALLPSKEQLIDAIGTTFTDPLMISTTTDPEIACHFSDTLFVIYASKAAMDDLGAISIDSILHTAEKEILMCANASYRVLDVGTMAVEGTDAEGQPHTYYRNYVTVELLGGGE